MTDIYLNGNRVLVRMSSISDFIFQFVHTLNTLLELIFVLDITAILHTFTLCEFPIYLKRPYPSKVRPESRPAHLLHIYAFLASILLWM